MQKKAIFDFSKGKKTPVKNLSIGILAALSAAYLIMPTLGIFELIPDAIPFVGQLDEFTAVMLLLGALRYFGIDLVAMFTGDSNDDIPNTTVEPRYEPPVK